MNRFTRYSACAALAACALAMPALSQDIVVSTSARQALAEHLAADLETQLDRVLRASRSEISGGYAIVRFTRGADGTPDDVTLFRNAGDRDVARLAQRAITRLSATGALPHGIGRNQLYQANVVIADSRAGIDRWNRRLGRDEATRIAAAPDKRAVLTFGNGAMPGH